MTSLPNTLSPPIPKLHFSFIDALRGLAALWVVLFHAHLGDRLAHLSAILSTAVVAIVFEQGGLGVPIFFTLSGFVMAHSLRNATISVDFLKQFALRRFARLNPPYYASIAFVLLLAAAAAAAKHEPFLPMDAPLSPQRLFAHLLYLQDVVGVKHFNDVYWTLCLEVQFYFAFVGLLWLSQSLQVHRHWTWERTVAIVFGGAALASLLHPFGIVPLIARPVWFLPHFHSFLAGVFAYWGWQQRINPSAFYAFVGPLAVAAIARESSFALTAAVVAITLLEFGQAQRLSLLSQPMFQWLGKVSYSLYLIHTPVLGAVFFVGYKLTGQSLATELLWLVVGISVSLGIAALSWRWVEVPAMRWSHQLKHNWNKRRKEIYA